MRSPSRTAALFVAFLFPVAVSAQETTSADSSTVPWQRHRVVWFVDAENPVSAQISVGCEKLAWDPDIETAWRDMGPGEFSLFGSRWVCLDTFSDLRIDEQKVKAGSYLLALGKSRRGHELLWYDAERVLSRGSKMRKLKPVCGTLLESEAVVTEGGTRKQTLAIEVSDSGPGHATLSIAYGWQRLSLPIAVTGSAGATPYTLADPRRTALWKPTPDTEVFLEYGSPPWTEATAAVAQGIKDGTRWRLGQNWWTSLRTNTPLKLGRAKLAPGNYHLSLQVDPDQRASLLIHDASMNATSRVDAVFSARAKVLAKTPLEKVSGSPAKRLEMGFVTKGSASHLALRFGPHGFRARISTR